ncbi:hypothetical protein RN001_006427 [Aquatica leii]|uniref:Uncharacterized protein n=1 Tax=Aquatica leii TaxID=1421715 RepID=A0AAN7SQ78_9COLE|nr:hypothetical protein RN001_006427 [Aquatica leii]
MAMFLKGRAFLRLSSVHISQFRRICDPSRKGLLLGVYSEENQGVTLTDAGNKYNQSINGKLCPALNLSVTNFQ